MQTLIPLLFFFGPKKKMDLYWHVMNNEHVWKGIETD